jgi:hypothetical protein
LELEELANENNTVNGFDATDAEPGLEFDRHMDGRDWSR